MDLYQLDSMVANWQSQIYDRDNLIQTLANIEHSDFADEIHSLVLVFSESS